MFFVPGKTLVYDVKLPTPKEIKPNLKNKTKNWKLNAEKQKIKWAYTMIQNRGKKKKNKKKNIKINKKPSKKMIQ